MPSPRNAHLTEGSQHAANLPFGNGKETDVAFETEKQLEAMPARVSTLGPAKKRRKRKGRSKKTLRPAKIGTPGQQEALRQRKWLFNVHVAMIVALAALSIGTAFFGEGQSQALGEGGVRMLLAFLFGVAATRKTGEVVKRAADG